ncbi:MAG: RHS repeat-associated core domain-containing protein, partial [Acidimicrobiia bacterium]
QVTNFAWDINSSLPEVAHERDGAGAMLRRYTYGSGRVAMTSGGADHYYHGDRLGSVVGVSGNFGTPEAAYSYEPYGLPRTTTGTLANPMRFTGQYTDDTGLQYLRARYYDQGTGRFLSTDPVPPAITDPYVANYVYANNRPTVATDPSGLFCLLGNRGGPSGGCRFASDTVNTVLKSIAFAASAAALVVTVAATGGLALPLILGAVAVAASVGGTVLDCTGQGTTRLGCTTSIAATALGAVTFGYGAAADEVAAGTLGLLGSRSVSAVSSSLGLGLSGLSFLPPEAAEHRSSCNGPSSVLNGATRAGICRAAL